MTSKHTVRDPRAYGVGAADVVEDENGETV